MDRKNASSSSFPMGETAQEERLPYVPECYKVKLPSGQECSEPVDFPVIDLAGMSDPIRRVILVEEVGTAFRDRGFFHVVNHGISQGILDGALSAASGFFNLPTKDKAPFMSSDVHKPIRYCTSLKDGIDSVQCWRAFLKHYSHPLNRWIGMWPHNPPDYRKNMGQYVEAVQKLSRKLTGLATESLGLGPMYLDRKLDEGMQVMTVNCYPPCPQQPELALGLPPHSDYSCLTVLLQSSPGLQMLDHKNNLWRPVPVIPGALQVQVGDQMEVVSNGRYKSPLHRVALKTEKTRISIAALHTLGMDVKAEAAEAMVDEHHPKGYRQNSFKDFLDFIAENDIAQGRRFLNTIKLAQ